MPMKPKISRETLENYLKQGLTAGQISERTGLHRSTVLAAAKRNGLKLNAERAGPTIADLLRLRRERPAKWGTF